MKFTTLILTGCIIIITQASYCLSQSHYGTEFVFGIPHNHHFESQCKEIYVSIAAYSRGTYNFTVPYLNIEKTGTIQPNLTEIKLNCSIAKFGTFTDRRGLYLKASIDVAVYVTNYFKDTAETFLVIPVPETGEQYSTAAYQPSDSSERSFVMVAASNPETHGCIYNDTNGRFVTNFSLNLLEVFQLSSTDTLHGIRVIADKQVAVITGTSCTTIPHGVSACDIITEQMIPTKSWDKIYIAPPTPPKEAYELRVTKANSSVSGQICFHNRSKSYCGNDSTISIRMGIKPTVILSDNTVSVVQFGFGNDYPLTNVGDPFMTVIPGLGNFLNNYSFAIPNVYRNAQNHLSIIIPTKYIQGLVLDGVNLTIAHNDMLNVSKPLDNYTVVILNIGSGYHHLYHTENYVKFGLLIYGMGTTSDKFVGFGYPGGMRLSGSDTFTTPTTNIAVTSPLPDGNVTNAVLSSTQTIGNNASTTVSTSVSATSLPDRNVTYTGLNSTNVTLNNSQTKETELNRNSTSLQDTKNKTEKSSLGIILGAVIGAVFGILLLACLIFFLAKKRGKPAVQPENTENTESYAGEDKREETTEQKG